VGIIVSVGGGQTIYRAPCRGVDHDGAGRRLVRDQGGAAAQAAGAHGQREIEAYQRGMLNVRQTSCCNEWRYAAVEPVGTQIRRDSAMIETTPDIAGEIGRMPLFTGADPGALAAVVRATSRRRFRRDEQEYRQGAVPRAFYHVLSGHVRRAIASSEGEEKVIDIVSPGEYFGLADLFGGAAHVAFAETVEPTLLLEIDKAAVMGAIEADRALMLRVLTAVAHGKVALERDVAACFFQSGARRLLDYLVREAGPRLAPVGDTAFQLPVSKRLIAARLGVSAETLSRALRELSEAGLIAVRGREIILREKLAARCAAQAAKAAAGAGSQPVPHERRRRDPWIEQTSLVHPLGSRAWM
jgi:CRP-like cAMP-binding protein